MLERQVVIPASPEEIWTALTEPASVSAWFGSRVEWDLRPGGQARFHDDDGTSRHGVIDAVLPGRRLSFRWWREDDAEESRVTYDLEPEESGTRLTVTEQPLTRGPAPGTATPTARGTASAVAMASVGSWTAWDSRLFACWARSAASAAVGRAFG